MAKCIYCNAKEADSGEHFMPACLGRFRNFEQLNNKLCSECNRKIGKLEEQFCRCGPEQFFRIIKGIKGREHHRKVNPFYRGSAGGGYIVAESRHPTLDCMIFCEIEEGGENAFPARIFFKSRKAEESTWKFTQYLTIKLFRITSLLF